MRDMTLPAVPGIGKPITASEVMRIEEIVANGVMLIDDIESLQEWRAQAAALEAYLRSRELQRPMLGAQRRVEARIGQLLGEAKRGRPNGDDNPNHGEDLNDVQISQFRILANGFDCLDAEEWRKSRRALVSLVRQKCGLVPETPELPHGQFRCIVADPPWKLDTGPDVFGGTGERGHDALAYEQMSLDDIKALPVEDRSADRFGPLALLW